MGSANEYYYPNLFENQFTPREQRKTQEEMRAHLDAMERNMNEFRIFMQAQLEEKTPSQDQIREMNIRLQSLEQTCEYLHTA